MMKQSSSSSSLPVIVIVVVIGILLLTIPVTSATSTKQEEEKNDNDNDHDEQDEYLDCGVYMAPSTLGEGTNMGIYTGIPLRNGDVLNYPEIVIPLMFREWSDHGDNYDGSLWDRYIWEGPTVNLEAMNDILDTDSSRAAFIPGIGCTINSRMDLRNIDSTHGSTYDTAGVSRTNVGAGAFSPYHSSQTTAVRTIPAGGELFAEYGYEWIPQIDGAIVTLDDTMDTADDLLRTYVEWYNDQRNRSDTHHHGLSQTIVDGLWNFTTHFPIHSDVLNTLPKDESWTTVMQTVEDKRRFLKNNNNKDKEEDEDEDDEDEDIDDNEASSVVRYFLRKQGIRSIEWLRRNGKCQDHLRPGISTIPHAGRGAFAARNLPKGTVVGYSPLIHMGNNRELWDITYKSKPKSNNNDNNNDHSNEYVQQDLILNYSFGHRQSTLLLTPYGAMVNFINHSSQNPNVKIQWPTRELVAHKPDWLVEKDLEFLIHTIDKIGLSFDYVAIRDIKEGEEVLMDYGTEWEAAWNEHVRNWIPPSNANTYMHSTEWPRTKPLLTLSEQQQQQSTSTKESSYPSNLVTICIESFSYDAKRDVYVWTPPVRQSSHRVHCKVLERHERQRQRNDDNDDDNNNDDDSCLYTVQYNYSKHETMIVHDVPRKGIELTDDLYTADWHMEQAFRHEIMIPDDMFPEQWKNRKELKFKLPKHLHASEYSSSTGANDDEL